MQVNEKHIKNLPHAQVFCLNEEKNLHMRKKVCVGGERKYFSSHSSTRVIDYEAKLQYLNFHHSRRMVELTEYINPNKR